MRVALHKEDKGDDALFSVPLTVAKDFFVSSSADSGFLLPLLLLLRSSSLGGCSARFQPPERVQYANDQIIRPYHPIVLQ